MKITLQNMNIQASEECGSFCDVDADAVEEHPNASKFEGILLVVDEPSTRPPNGAEGHRILVPKSVAEERKHTLVGMGLNYAPGLNRHNPTHKVGVIERAWIKGKNLWCSGILWMKDFPDAVAKLRNKEMGMSMELADVLVEEKNADVWKLIDFDFTGATALLKSAAAYERTTLAASACEIPIKGEHAAMKTTSSHKSGNGDLAKLIAAAVGTAMTVALKPVASQLKEVNASLQTQNETIGHLAAATLEAKQDDDDATASKDSDDATANKDSDDATANADSDDATANMDSDDAAGAGKKDTSADTSSSSSSDSEYDDDELKAELADLGKNVKNDLATNDSGDDDPKPGKLNRNSKSHGSKKTVSASAAPRKVYEIAASALQTSQRVRKDHRKVVKALQASNSKVEELQEQVEEMQAQADEFSTAIQRRSLPANYAMLLEKGGHSVSDITASGQKLTNEQVDSMIHAARESGVNMSIQDRMNFKTKLVELGLYA